jgi:hypothetical protein
LQSDFVQQGLWNVWSNTTLSIVKEAEGTPQATIDAAEKVEDLQNNIWTIWNGTNT